MALTIIVAGCSSEFEKPGKIDADVIVYGDACGGVAAAGTAACMAIDESVSVQQVDYARLKKRLLGDGQRLE